MAEIHALPKPPRPPRRSTQPRGPRQTKSTRTTEAREATTFRMVRSHRTTIEDILDQLADSIGYAPPLGDYFAWCLARMHGLETPDYLRYLDEVMEGRDIVAIQQPTLDYGT